ncbi:MAG: putative baseplate assembly protein [Planctomycetota bacterium]|nr:MAG: putative baseplate assembly protein [Planctomycetota bacterium]
MSEQDDPRTPGSCCSETAGAPERPRNPPQLPALRYRFGTQAAFLRRMIERLPRPAPVAGAPRLSALTTRAADDPSIALLDACAAVADVLCFYQERIANEGFLRTAAERRSVLELARSVGYELGPGVAASAWLAFEVETAAGAPASVDVPRGTRVQSVPGPGQKPQTFETSEPLVARPEWNAMPVRATTAWRLEAGGVQLRLQGLSTGLQAGDGLLLAAERQPKVELEPRELRLRRELELRKEPEFRKVLELRKQPERRKEPEEWEFRILSRVEPRPADNVTVVAWREPLRWRTGAVATVYALRQRASVFGHNARKADLPELAAAVRANQGNAQVKAVDLDGAFAQIQAGSWMVLSAGHVAFKEKSSVRRRYGRFLHAAQLRRVELLSRADYGLSGKVTSLHFRSAGDLSDFQVRYTTVYAQSEELVPAELPASALVRGTAIELAEPRSGLRAGQHLIVSGVPSGGDGETVESEHAVVAQVERGGRVLRLERALQRAYVPATTRVRANVTRATHGESVAEVLGSGDASQAHQSFVLRRAPLTFVEDPASARGSASTLELRVDGVRWTETPSLHDLDAVRASYALRNADDGRTTVQFGDGRNGARLPSGVENVRATYRVGLGPEGEVAAGKLTLLQTRPAGIRGVTNPIAASGAGSPEVLERARANAPRSVLTLDRVVSLRDYEAFARGFAGIGKAQAVALWSGERRVVHITAALENGRPIDEDKKRALLAGLARHRDPDQQVLVDGFTERRFRIHARVGVDPRLRAEQVLAGVRARLREAFGFARREFGQPVSAAEAIAVMQSEPGVLFVHLESLSTGPAPGRSELLLLDESEDAVRLEVATA